jgi:hypothetical protein
MKFCKFSKTVSKVCRNLKSQTLYTFYQVSFNVINGHILRVQGLKENILDVKT